ncbi:MAG TPA: hypothetical protein VIH03_08645 [Nitrososphaerales archaeon]
MTLRRLLVGLLLIILLLPTVATSINAQQAKEERTYDEILSITVVSNIGLWKIKEIGLNVSSLGVSGAESIANVQEYELLFTKHSDYDSRVEFFKSYGYNVLGFDLLPEQGAVLRVNASSLDAARQVATVLENAFRLSFIYIKTNGNNHLFYSSAELGRPQDQKFLPINLWNLFTGRGGLDTLVTIDTFQINPMPMLGLNGKRGTSGFTYTIWVGGIAPDATSSGSIKYDNFFQFIQTGGINASRTAKTSTLEFKTFGQLVTPQDKYDFTHITDVRGSTAISLLSPNENRSRFNFDYKRTPANLIVTRSVDKSSVVTGDTVEYRVRFENTGPVGPTAGGIAVDFVDGRETWWQQHFDAVRAESNTTIRNLEPGQSKTFVYLLRARTTTEAVASTSEANSVFSYNYTIANRKFTSTARGNDMNIVLNRGAASLVAEGSATDYYPTTPGNASLVLLVRNGGTRTAFNVKAFLGDKLITTIPTVSPDPIRPERVTAPIPFDNFALKKRDLFWRIEWTDDNRVQSVSSNTIPIFENYTSTAVPILTIQKSSVQNKTKGDGVYETRIMIINKGKAATGVFEILDFPPKGTTFSSGDFSPSGQGVSVAIDNILPDSNKTVSYLSRGSTKMNVITGPAFIRFKVGEQTSEVVTRSIVSADAVTLQKTTNTQRGFIAYNFTANLSFKNEGAETVYNVGIDGRDTPLKVVKGDNVAAKDALAPGESINMQYSLQTFKAQNASQIGAYARFTLAGSILETATKAIPIEVYNAPQVKIRLEDPSLLDNRPYRILVEIANPSPLPISALSITQNIVENFKMSGGDLTAEASRQLAPGEKITLSVTGVSTEPNKQMRFAPKITHFYEGQTVVVPISELNVLVGEDITARFAMPVGAGIAIVLATWILVRRAVQKPEEKV